MWAINLGERTASRIMARVVLDWGLEKSMRLRLSRIAFLQSEWKWWKTFTIDSCNYWIAYQNEVCELKHTHTYSVHSDLDSHTSSPKAFRIIGWALPEVPLWKRKTGCAKYLKSCRLLQWIANHSIWKPRINQTSAHTINKCWSASKNSKSFDVTIFN